MEARTCPRCDGSLLIDARGSVAIWQFRRVPENHLDFLMRELATALGLRAVVQPVVISEIPYKRFGWRGLAATPMLNDLLAKQRRGLSLNLGVTGSNIVPDSRHNFSLVWRMLVFRLPFLASNCSLGIIPRIEGSKTACFKLLLMNWALSWP